MKQCNTIANISSIETMGLVDGPGIRVVLFLQGCKLRCLYCHNPETWCETNKSLMSVEEVVNKVLRYKSYIAKNGGVTFSGGEPLLQSDFVYECARKLKKQGIHICLDTSGVGNNYNKVLDLIDLCIIDVKAIKEEEYKYITGLDMGMYNQFIQDIQKTNIKIWLRQVIVPGINDDETHIIELANYANSLNNIEKVELLGYHTYGETKYETLNIKYRLKDIPALSKEKELYLNDILNKHLNLKKSVS